MRRGMVVLSAACMFVVGCAQPAERIEPAAISTAKYEGWNCQKLAREKAFVDEALVRTSATQDRAASNDALMVFLIGVPTSGGGVTGEVARLKGEQEALRRALVERNCRAS